MIGAARAASMGAGMWRTRDPGPRSLRAGHTCWHWSSKKPIWRYRMVCSGMHGESDDHHRGPSSGTAWGGSAIAEDASCRPHWDSGRGGSVADSTTISGEMWPRSVVPPR
jgi:hypothetical protein